jgi:hypothetical protein
MSEAIEQDKRVTRSTTEWDQADFDRWLEVLTFLLPADPLIGYSVQKSGLVTIFLAAQQLIARLAELESQKKILSRDGTVVSLDYSFRRVAKHYGLASHELLDAIAERRLQKGLGATYPPGPEPSGAAPADVPVEVVAAMRAATMRLRDDALAEAGVTNAPAARSAPVHKGRRALWDNRQGADAKLTPPKFIAKHYAAEMAAGTLHRGMIGQEDKSLAVKLANWLRTHPMPEGVDIPTLPEWNTRQLAKLEDGEFERLARLHEVAKTRRRKLAVPAAV